MSFLSHDELNEITKTLVESGLDLHANRGAFFQSISPQYVGVLPIGGSPVAQTMGDLGSMNRIERLANGQVPLEIYLKNAALLLSGFEEQTKVIREAIDRVRTGSTGAPKIDLADVPERKERIIFTDDTVPYMFMAAGVKAAASVMRLRVARFENGAPKISGGSPVQYLGTGWLLGRKLLITNHHVINARNDGEPNSSEADLRSQGAAAVVEMDFDADGVMASTVTNGELVAWDTDLDYAVIKIPQQERDPLPIAPDIFAAGSDPIPVNIIQHPGGKSKRYGIRNNLVSSATERDLRYFTDTESGSSGSPVMNDRWEVIALHKASKFVSNVQFQGKSTAYVNIGTHMRLIVDDIENRFPGISGEIGD